MVSKNGKIAIGTARRGEKGKSNEKKCSFCGRLGSKKVQNLIDVLEVFFQKQGATLRTMVVEFCRARGFAILHFARGEPGLGMLSRVVVS